MHPLVRLLAACFIVCLGSCGEVAVKSHEVRKSASAEDRSWTAFQKALANRDVQAVASMTEFPLKNDLMGIEGFDGIGSRKTFVRDFGTLFPSEVIPTLLKYPPSPAEIRSKRWSVSHDEPNAVSEMEWSMIYHFELTSDGEVRLKLIQMAG